MLQLKILLKFPILICVTVLVGSSQSESTSKVLLLKNMIRNLAEFWVNHDPYNITQAENLVKIYYRTLSRSGNEPEGMREMMIREEDIKYDQVGQLLIDFKNYYSKLSFCIFLLNFRKKLSWKKAYKCLKQ